MDAANKRNCATSINTLPVTSLLSDKRKATNANMMAAAKLTAAHTY